MPWTACIALASFAASPVVSLSSDRRASLGSPKVARTHALMNSTSQTRGSQMLVVIAATISHRARERSETQPSAIVALEHVKTIEAYAIASPNRRGDAVPRADIVPANAIRGLRHSGPFVLFVLRWRDPLRCHSNSPRILWAL